MASLVEKYELILAADPRSRVFVELAKALVERGDHVRAAEVCKQGLEHHPSSILGRVIWGRALLEAGEAKGALDHFEIAIALEPSSPYAYNLIGEALVAKGLHRDALPVLARAMELQPGDARVKAWLDDAKRRVLGDPPAAQTEEPAGGPAADGSAAAGTAPGNGASEAAPAAHPTPGNGVAPGQAPAAASPTNGATGGETGAAAPGSPDAAPPASGAAEQPASGPPPLPPPLKQTPSPRSVLQMIPGATREMRAAAPAPRTRTAVTDPAEAMRIAAQYERELREKLMSAPEPPPPFFQRHRRAILAALVVFALGAAAAVYLVVDARNARILAATAAGRGRAGLARDTLASLREAHRLLSEARRRSRSDAEVASLAAQVAAVLASDYGDADAREAAQKLAEDPDAGDGAVAARWLLAGGPAERKAVEADVLAASPSSAPLLQALAGRILLSRGEIEAGRGRLEIAARANPPLLRALSDLGDAALAGHDPDAALALYGSALAAHPTHARSVVGAAEARLELGRDLATARKELEAVEADPGSAPPQDLRLRYEIAFARVLAATGDPAAGAERLAKAVETLGDPPVLADALAELYLSARAWDKAEAVAARAMKREPREAGHRLLLARARNGRAHFAEALAATEGQEGRAIRVQRAIARCGLGQWRAARAELEKTARDGKMPAEAAVWYAITDVELGRAERARALLEKLAAAKSPPPLVHVALGRALEALGKPDDAEQAYRSAVEREPDAPEGHLALGRLLLSRGRTADAVAELERAAQIDASDVAARRALGEARLAAGQPAAARGDLDFVRLASPRDAHVLRLISAAWLAEGQAAEARRAADEAISFAPRDPAVLLAGARAARAAGDAAGAGRFAARALKSGAKGVDAAEARDIAGGAARKKAR